MLKPETHPLGGLDMSPFGARRTVQDQVYQRLAHALMSGRIDPGQQLTIASLSDMYGTSHMPVREALRRLAGENALEVATTGSAYVPAISLAKLDDLCLARVINEGAAAERAAANASPRMIRQLEKLVEEHVEAARERDLPGITSKNQEFHFTLYRAAESPVMLRIIETLWLQFGPYLRLLTREIEPSLKLGEQESYTRHHFGILDALKRQDAAAVGRGVVADIQATQALLRPLCEAADGQGF